jgi:hypothetical protein
MGTEGMGLARASAVVEVSVIRTSRKPPPLLQKQNWNENLGDLFLCHVFMFTCTCDLHIFYILLIRIYSKLFGPKRVEEFWDLRNSFLFPCLLLWSHSLRSFLWGLTPSILSTSSCFSFPTGSATSVFLYVLLSSVGQVTFVMYTCMWRINEPQSP